MSRVHSLSWGDGVLAHNIMGHTSYRVSGHESFACRYAWLPKVAHHLNRDSGLLADEPRAMVELGVGKNMVRSIRFWAQSAGIAVPNGHGGLTLTSFAKGLLGERGLDPYLEDIRTLWLIHWKLATGKETPLLAWDYLINNWHEPEITPTTVIAALKKETTKQGDNLSASTITQHFDTFLHTYVPTRSRKGEILEDNLDCPLVELEFIVQRGESKSGGVNGRREPIYAFNRERKAEISSELFVYALNSYWDSRHPQEETLSLREVAHGHGSPGQIFKLPEDDVRTRLEELNRHVSGPFSYAESVNLQQARRKKISGKVDLLKRIYRS